MDNPATVVMAIFGGLTIGVPILGALMFGAFQFGRGLFDRLGATKCARFAIPLICAFWTPVFLIGQLVPGSGFSKGTVGLMLFLLNAYPSVIGFAARKSQFEVDSNRRFQKNVDDWLGQWEHGDSNADLLLKGNDDDNLD